MIPNIRRFHDSQKMKTGMPSIHRRAAACIGMLLCFPLAVMGAEEARVSEAGGAASDLTPGTNIVDHTYKKFDASQWPVEPSGLLGPVKLIPLSPADSPAAKKDKPIKVFVLLGDENILEQGVISGTEPGTLETVVARNPKYAFLKSKDGRWVTRDDVVVYDLNPLLNNTVTIGHCLQVGDVPYGGKEARRRMGVELMFGTVMGEHFREPVLLVRYANNGYRSASLGHNYLPPSSGGAGKITGGWDVIHFNWGVWDAMYHDKSSKYYQGHGNTTAVADYEQNLRTLVARLKQTGRR